MSHRSFNHLFLPLMVLSAISAFFIPVEYTSFCRGRLDGLFSPIATPLRRLVDMTSTRLGLNDQDKELILHTSNLTDANREIDRLQVTVASLTVQIEELRRLNAGRDLGGELRNFSRPFKVLSPDLAGRDSLSIHATTGDGVAVGMPVVCQQGLVGKISAVGNLGAQVRLITDVGSRISGQFGKFQLKPDGSATFTPIATNEPLIEGRGHGLMAITNITKKEADDSHLTAGDWVVLSDRDMWPATVNGQRLGQIIVIQKLAKSPLHAEILLKPLVNFDTLREVMVVTGQQTPVAQPKPKSAVKPTIQPVKNDRPKQTLKPAG
ncbi:MAG TPA: rod shape-determining protein MreC [Tepidisphaeraceae bacterium]|nr:rod shape-determining protein MreC [Tepidisphaeraceae bacterium]